MDVVADFPADAQAAEPVQQGEGTFDDPAVNTEAGAVVFTAAGDGRGDSHVADKAAVFVVVVGPVGVDPARPARGGPGPAGSRGSTASAE